MEQLVARIRGELVEHIARCVGESRTETKHLLKFLFRIERDGFRGVLPRARPPCQSRGAFEAALFIGHPHCNLAGTGIGWRKGSPGRRRFSNRAGRQYDRGYSQKVTSRTLGRHFSSPSDQVLRTRISCLSNHAENRTLISTLRKA